MLLFERDVKKACEKHYENHQSNCSGFIRAVAKELLVLIPGITSNADGQVTFMKLINTPSFRHLGDGQKGELEAVRWASSGDFVICGMKSTDLQTNRPGRTVKHGHVAIVVGGWSPTKWPLAYWGSLGGSGGKNASLSKTFRAADRPSISYFGYRLPRG